jgi:hypothetical protein
VIRVATVKRFGDSTVVIPAGGRALPVAPDGWLYVLMPDGETVWGLPPVTDDEPLWWRSLPYHITRVRQGVAR